MTCKNNVQPANQSVTQHGGVPVVDYKERPDIEAGDVISYVGDLYKVLEKHGEQGRVAEYPITEDSVIIDPFYWYFAGEKCEIVEKAPK